MWCDLLSPEVLFFVLSFLFEKFISVLSRSFDLESLTSISFASFFVWSKPRISAITQVMFGGLTLYVNEEIFVYMYVIRFIFVCYVIYFSNCNSVGLFFLQSKWGQKYSVSVWPGGEKNFHVRSRKNIFFPFLVMLSIHYVNLKLFFHIETRYRNYFLCIPILKSRRESYFTNWALGKHFLHALSFV